MREPGLRSEILGDVDIAPHNEGSMENLYQGLQMAIPLMFAVDDVVDYESTSESTFAARAAALGASPEECIYDFLCEGDGINVASLMGAGYVHGNLDAMREMLVDANTVTGLADAGAHVKLICDGTAPTTQLTLCPRDRRRGERIGIEYLVE